MRLKRSFNLKTTNSKAIKVKIELAFTLWFHIKQFFIKHYKSAKNMLLLFLPTLRY